MQKLNQSAELPSKRHNGREAFHELSESVDFVAESTSRPSTLVRPVEIAAKLAETVAKDSRLLLALVRQN